MKNYTSNWLQAIISAAMPWMELIAQILLAWVVVLIVQKISAAVLKRISAPYPFSRRLVREGSQAAGLTLFFLILQVILNNDADSRTTLSVVYRLTALGLIIALTWFGVRCVRAIAGTIIELNPIDVADNLRARRVQTQAKVFSRSMMVLIILAGSGMALMTLPHLRQIGTSLLASAGVAGLAVGIAARPVLSNLLAGLQLALTQPIRLEDVVIVDNEWGHVEEITGTYVVVRIWDQRRMIVPLQWFIEHPFQNWTRTDSEILGTVLIWVDYQMPLDPVRKEAERICQNAVEWNKRTCITQVAETSDHAMQLRVLVSADDAGRLWDLRCKIREGIVYFIQHDYPEYLPRLRTDVVHENKSANNGSVFMRAVRAPAD